MRRQTRNECSGLPDPSVHRLLLYSKNRAGAVTLYKPPSSGTFSGFNALIIVYIYYSLYTASARCCVGPSGLTTRSVSDALQLLQGVAVTGLWTN